MSEDLNHLCLAGTQCWGVVVEADKSKTPAQTMAPDTLCDSCMKGLERTLTEIPSTWVSLYQSMGEKQLHIGARVSGSRSLPVNINVDVDRIKVALTSLLVVAGERVHDSCNMTGEPPTLLSARDGECARVVDQVCTILKHRLDKLVALPADAVMDWQQRFTEDETGVWYRDTLVPEDKTGVEIALELMRLNKIAKVMLGQTNPRQQQSLPCPLCMSQQVYRVVVRSVSGKVYDEVSCEACGMRRSYDDFQQLAVMAERHITEERAEQMRQQRDREVERLQEQLAEARLTAAAAVERLDAVRKVADLDDADGYDGVTIQAYLREVLGDAA